MYKTSHKICRYTKHEGKIQKKCNMSYIQLSDRGLEWRYQLNLEATSVLLVFRSVLITGFRMNLIIGVLSPSSPRTNSCPPYLNRWKVEFRHKMSFMYQAKNFIKIMRKYSNRTWNSVENKFPFTICAHDATFSQFKWDKKRLLTALPCNSEVRRFMIDWTTSSHFTNIFVFTTHLVWIHQWIHPLLML